MSLRNTFNKKSTFKKTQIYEEHIHQKDILLWGAIIKLFFTSKPFHKTVLNLIILGD